MRIWKVHKIWIISSNFDVFLSVNWVYSELPVVYQQISTISDVFRNKHNRKSQKTANTKMKMFFFQLQCTNRQMDLNSAYLEVVQNVYHLMLIQCFSLNLWGSWNILDHLLYQLWFSNWPYIAVKVVRSYQTVHGIYFHLIHQKTLCPTYSKIFAVPVTVSKIGGTKK